MRRPSTRTQSTRLSRQRLEALLYAVRAFTEAVPTYDELLAVVTQRIAAATGDLCTVRILSEDGLRLLPVAGDHPDPAVRAHAWEAMHASESIGADVWLPAIRERQLLRLNIDPAKPPFGASTAQREFMRRHRASSLVVAPLVARGHVLGGVSLTRLGEGAPHTDAEVDFLTAVADRAALAIDNARLVRDLRQRDEWLEAANAELRARISHLNTVTEAGRVFSASTLDLAELGQAVCQQVALAVGDGCTIWLTPEPPEAANLILAGCYHRDPEIDRLLAQALEPVIRTPADELDDAFDRPEEEYGVRVMALCAERVRAALRPDFQNDPALVRPTVALVAALGVRGGLLGLLVASRDAERGAYTRSDESLLSDLVDRAAIALDNARLYQAARIQLAERERAEGLLSLRANQQRALAQLGRAALEGVDLPTLFDTAATMARQLLEVDKAIVLVLPEQGGELQVGAAVGWGEDPADTQAPLEAVRAQAVQTLELGEAVVVPDPARQGRVRVPRKWRALGFTSGVTIVVPGKLGLGPRGVFGIHSARPRCFTSEEIALLEGFGNVLGAGIARKEAEDAMFRREEEFRALVENAPDIIARFDRNLRRVYVNPAIERATGQPAERFIGRTNRELGMQLTERWEMVASQVFRTGREQIMELWFDTPTGRREYQTRITPEFAADGTVASVLTVARDITDLQQAEVHRTALLQESLQREAQLQELVSRVLTNQAQDARRAMRSSDIERLTSREREILRLVVAGQTNGEIARRLGLAVGTVKNHIARMLPKLGAADRTQAAVRAVEAGLLETDTD